jgi:putative membrane protein
MKIIRTILWVLVVVALAIFSAFNWETVNVKIWEGLILETKKPVLVILPFLAGLLPMWALHFSTRWRLKRRVSSLESAVRNAVAAKSQSDNPSLKPEGQ